MEKKRVQIPSVGESVTEVSLARLIVSEGNFAKEGEPLFEIESDKASMEVPAPFSGTVHYLAKVGDTLKIGQEIAEIDLQGAPKSEVKQAPQEAVQKKEERKEELPPPPAKKETSEGGIRKGAEEFFATLHKKEEVRIVKEVEEEASQERKPMSKLRKTIAKRLVQVKNETAMLTTFNEVDMSQIMHLRDREKEAFQKRCGAKLTFLPFFIKAAVFALKRFPDVNAYIDGEEIVYNQGVHMGIAVSTDTGLVVPVIRNADKLSLIMLSKAIQELANKAKERKLTVADMSGGTFTITNGGVFGSMLSTPILNPPQSAILGMHNIVERPVAVNGKVEIRPIMYLALSYDHRIIDGKESVGFLVYMKELLEEPGKFLLYE